MVSVTQRQVGAFSGLRATARRAGGAQRAAPAQRAAGAKCTAFTERSEGGKEAGRKQRKVKPVPMFVADGTVDPLLVPPPNTASRSEVEHFQVRRPHGSGRGSVSRGADGAKGATSASAADAAHTPAEIELSPSPAPGPALVPSPPGTTDVAGAGDAAVAELAAAEGSDVGTEASKPGTAQPPAAAAAVGKEVVQATAEALKAELAGAPVVVQAALAEREAALKAAKRELMETQMALRQRDAALVTARKAQEREATERVRLSAELDTTRADLAEAQGELGGVFEGMLALQQELDGLEQEYLELVTPMKTTPLEDAQSALARGRELLASADAHREEAAEAALMRKAIHSLHMLTDEMLQDHEPGLPMMRADGELQAKN